MRASFCSGGSIVCNFVIDVPKDSERFYVIQNVDIKLKRVFMAIYYQVEGWRDNASADLDGLRAMRRSSI